MNLGEVFEVTVRTYVAKARSIVPFYFFIPSTLAIARVVPFLGVAAAIVLLRQSGALEEIQAELVAAGPIAIDDFEDDEALLAEPGAEPDFGVSDAIGEIIVGEPVAVLIVLAAVFSMYFVVPAILWVSAAGRLHGIVSVLTDPAGTPIGGDSGDRPAGEPDEWPPRPATHDGRIEDPVGPLGDRSAPSPSERWESPGPSEPERGTGAPDGQDGSETPEPERSADRPDGQDGSETPDRDRDSDAADDPGGSGDWSASKSPVTTGTGRRPLRDAVDGTFTHGLAFVGLLVLELIVLGASVFPFALFAVLGPLGLLFAGLYGVFWLFFVLPAIRVFFAFAKPAAVVDDTGVVGAVRGAGGFFRAEPVQAVAYGFLSIVAIVGLLVMSVLFAALDAGTLAALLAFLLVFPLLDTFKTILYADHADGITVRVPDSPQASVLARLRSELEAGFGTLRSFTVGHPGLVGANLLLFAFGLYLAWVGTAGIDGAFEASIERRIAGTFPPGMMVEYFANNWSVGIAQSFSGVALGVPSILSVLFNGLLIGAFVRFEVALVPFLAFVIPHGIVEIPALLLSGALGLYLGIVVWRYLRGRLDRAGLTDEIEYAYEVTMGLAILFAIAAVIEAFFSPYYWQLLGL